MALINLISENVHFRDSDSCSAAMIITEPEGVNVTASLAVFKPGLLNALITEHHSDIDFSIDNVTTPNTWHYPSLHDYV